MIFVPKFMRSIYLFLNCSGFDQGLNRKLGDGPSSSFSRRECIKLVFNSLNAWWNSVMRPGGPEGFFLLEEGGGRSLNYKFSFLVFVGLFRLSVSSWLNFSSL